jgi:hypothetical protein
MVIRRAPCRILHLTAVLNQRSMNFAGVCVVIPVLELVPVRILYTLIVKRQRIGSGDIYILEQRFNQSDSINE